MKRRERASQSHYHLNLGTVKTIQRKHSVVTIHFFKVIVSDKIRLKCLNKTVILRCQTF